MTVSERERHVLDRVAPVCIVQYIMTHTPGIDRPTLLRVAAEADVDPRSVQAELAAERGERPPVRGRVGERIREALARHRQGQAA